MKLENVIYCGDNLIWLKQFPEKCIDLIYLDPPFFSNRHYEVIFNDGEEIRSFHDRWKGGINHYIEWMKERIFELLKILKDTGSFYLHCDWHASHYLKVMCDEIFGYNNFRNEIVWQRTTAGKPIYKNFPKNIDNILWYTKSDNYFFEPVMQQLSNEDIKTFNLDDNDGRGKYNTQPIINPGYRPNLKYIYKDLQGREWKSPKNGWRFNEDRMHELEKDNRLYFKKTIREKYYLSERISKGKQISNIWTDIPIVSRVEFFGYPTQKPELLLERIIKASSNKNDLILDPFCGCGTTIAVAQRLQRKWIGIDVSPSACKLMKNRVEKNGARGVEIIGLPVNIDDLKALPPFEFQNWCVGALGGTINPKKVGDMGIDGFTFFNRYPIQVKQSENIGRNVVDNFETALQRDKKDRGYIIALSFGKGAYEEVARIKKEGLFIELLTVDKLLGFSEEKVSDKMFEFY